MSDYIHVRSLEKYHPGYRDRNLQWAKIEFRMVQGDPDCELIDNEVDWARLIKFILLELDAKKPVPLDPSYLFKKGFDLKKRPIELTLQMLHNFIEVIHNSVEDESKTCGIEKRREDIEKIREEAVYATHLEFVKLKDEEHKKLITLYGESTTASLIGRLNNYIGSSGRRYKSHYHTILSWASKEGVKRVPPPKKEPEPEPEERYIPKPEEIQALKDAVSKIGRKVV